MRDWLALGAQITLALGWVALLIWLLDGVRPVWLAGALSLIPLVGLVGLAFAWSLYLGKRRRNRLLREEFSVSVRPSSSRGRR